MLLFNPVKLVYRNAIGYRTDDFSQHGVGKMLEVWGESFQAIWGGNDEQIGEAIGATASRLNYLETNAVVMARAPRPIPLAYGDPWLAILYSVVPRVLWPQKPMLTEITNDRFAILFGFITEKGAERTAVAYPMVSDGYWNFGFYGVLIVSFIAGLFWQLLARAWRPGHRFAYVVCIVVLTDVNAISTLPGLFIGLPQRVFGVLLVVPALEWVGRYLPGLFAAPARFSSRRVGRGKQGCSFRSI